MNLNRLVAPIPAIAPPRAAIGPDTGAAPIAVEAVIVPPSNAVIEPTAMKAVLIALLSTAPPLEMVCSTVWTFIIKNVFTMKIKPGVNRERH
jgi:hypothetical protein